MAVGEYEIPGVRHLCETEEESLVEYDSAKNMKRDEGSTSAIPCAPEGEERRGQGTLQAMGRLISDSIQLIVLAQ
jgi:hypothetical protein